MNYFKIVLLTICLTSNFIFCQTEKEFTTLKTNTSDVKIPGVWEQLNKMNDSGQTYMKNKEGIIIAVAQNPKKAYPTFIKAKSDYENVNLFYKWDSDYYVENKFKTKLLKENSKQEYIIWKYNDNKLDNVFLFGSSKDNFLNLLVYTDKWSEEQKITFLEELYQLNK